jgi:MFS family permease
MNCRARGEAKSPGEPLSGAHPAPGRPIQAEAEPKIPLWVVALSTTLGMQSVASFLDQSLPILGPLITARAGLAPERIGMISSLSALGVILFLLFGGPILARLGPVRMLQVGALTAVCGLAIAATGWWPLLALAAIMMGLGYGPSPPAGNRILAETAPARHRSLIFSVKQAGAPLGGALAGLILAPVAAASGWLAALAISISVGVIAAAVITLAARRLSFERAPDRPIGPSALFNPRNVVAPFLLLKESPALLIVTGLAFSFAVAQGSLFSFSVTYLTLDRHMPLAQAGFAYAVMQFSGVFARVFLGWLADRTGRPSLNLAVQALLAGTMLVGLGFLPDHVSLTTAALVCGATGFFAASWNGIYMAEIVRLSPARLVTETTSSSTVMVFLGYLSGPTIFSLCVSWSGNYRMPFLVIAAQLVLMAMMQLALLSRHARAAPG